MHKVKVASSHHDLQKVVGCVGEAQTCRIVPPDTDSLNMKYVDACTHGSNYVRQ